MRCPEILSQYLRDLRGSTSEGVEPTDEDFIALVGAVDKRAWDDVRDRVFTLDETKRQDVRVAAIAAYLAWREGGFAALPWIHEAIGLTAGKNHESFGPPKKKAAHLEIRAAWAFTTIADDIEYHHKAGSDEWRAWTKGLTVEVAERIGPTRYALETSLKAIGATRAAEALSKLSASVDPRVGPVLETIAEERAKAAAAAEERARAAQKAATAGPKTTASTPREEAMREHTRSKTELQPGAQVMELAVSHAFVELVQKLQAFEALVAKKKYQKAALVADDITEIVSKFDPRTFFPELFSSFGKHLAENVDVLAENWQRRETLSWKALEQFYRVDLQRFVDD